MPLTLRQQILLSFQAFDDTLYRVQAAGRRAAWSFGEFNIRDCISHIVPLAAELQNASRTCAKILELIDANFPPQTRGGLPPHDAVLKMLELSLAALNTARRFDVPNHRTDSEAIAAQLSDIIEQLGGQN